MSTRGSIPTYKVCLAGLPGVGKTSLFNSIRGKDFSENPRAEIDNYIHRTTVDFSGKKYEVNLQIWDTAGMDRYQSLTTSYYRKSHAVLLVFSLGCTESFDAINFIMEDIKRHDYAPDSMFFLVGNKCDLMRNAQEVQEERVSDFLTSNLPFFTRYNRTSAKTGDGLKELFSNIAHKLITKRVRPIKKKQEIDVIIQKSENRTCFCL